MNQKIASLPFESNPSDHDARSSSSYLLDELALHGYRPFEDEPIRVPCPHVSRTGPGKKNAAPFKRDDAMLEALPIGLKVFPGSDIVENLADKARKMGIPVWWFGKEGA